MGLEQLDNIRAILPERSHTSRELGPLQADNGFFRRDILSQTDIKIVVGIPSEPNEGIYCICQRIDKKDGEVKETLILTHRETEGNGSYVVIENGEVGEENQDTLEKLVVEILSCASFRVLLPLPDRKTRGGTFLTH